MKGCIKFDNFRKKIIDRRYFLGDTENISIWGEVENGNGGVAALNLEKYDEHVRELIHTIETKGAERESAVSECEELFEIAQQLKDDALAGYACFCHGDIYTNYQTDGETINYLTRAIQYLKKTEEWEILIKCYSYLGLAFQGAGDVTNAIDSFLAGMDIAEEHPVPETGGIIMNFSALCESSGDYERALFYRVRSFGMFEEMPASEKRDDYITAISAMLLRLYMKMDDEVHAKAEAEHLEELLKKYEKTTNGFGVYVNQLLFAQKYGEGQGEQELKKKTLDAFLQCENLIEYFDECAGFIRYLKLAEDYELLEKVLVHMTDTLEREYKDTETTREFSLKVLAEKISLYQRIGDDKKQYQELQRYFVLEEKRMKSQQESTRSLIQLRSTLRQAEIEKMFLMQQADMDALTGIPNRRRMNEQADQIMAKAEREQTSFGMAMLDMDHFKQWNDTYGHHTGDQCLVVLAEILKEYMDGKQFVFRYGGDEFMLLFDDMTDHEIMQRCRKIQEAVKVAGNKLGLDTLTVSIGIANWIPRKGNKVWDYASAADQTLYWVKRKGRDDVRLIHQMKELDEENGEVAC